MNPRRLTPGELVQILNSTPIGPVMRQADAMRHRASAGLRIGDGVSFDLLAYAAWLLWSVRGTSEPDVSSYEKLRAEAAARSRRQSAAGRDIATGEWVFPARDQRRRNACRMDFQRFCVEYMPETFALPWSDDHVKVISCIERAVLEGDLFAMAMPRGFGKTALCEAATLWSMLYGHHRFTVVIAADEGLARRILASMRVELEANDRMWGDFSEVCGPIRALEGIAARAAGQTFMGSPTRIEWSDEAAVLPTIPRMDWMDFDPPSGAKIEVCGLLGRIRGLKHKLASGETIRPSLVFIDDPQTDQSARSPIQSAMRERVVSGAILGLAGPGKKISGLMAATVICQGDMADRLLDRDKHPQWRGERTKMVYAWPASEKWVRYASLWADAKRAGRAPREAYELYSSNRAEMDDGAVVAWPEYVREGEISAIQCAINLRLERGEAAFEAEYQNDPRPTDIDDAAISGEIIDERRSGIDKGVVSARATSLVAFVDVQERLLYYMVVAFEGNFTSQIVDYGTFPEQVGVFTAATAPRTLATVVGAGGLEAAVRNGLDRLVGALSARLWRRGDGWAKVDRILVDANWQTDVVYEFCRTGVAIPAHGRYVGASSIPIDEYAIREGERVGQGWRYGLPSRSGRTVRRIIFDANLWKSFTRARLLTPVGAIGSCLLWGNPTTDHQLLTDHLVSEYSVRVTGRHRIVDEWKRRPKHTENHWWDCLVGCHVAASMGDVSLPGTVPAKTARRRVSYAEMQQRARLRAVND